MDFFYAVFLRANNGKFHVFVVHHRVLVFLRNSAEHIRDKAAKSVVIKLFRELDVENFGNIVKKHCSLKIKIILVDFAVFGFLVVVFVLNIAHDGLYQVLHGNNSRRSAVFVHHHGDLNFFLLKFKEGFAAAVRFGNEAYGTNEIRNLSLRKILFADKSKQILRVNNALDVVNGVLVNRHTGITVGNGEVNHLGDGCGNLCGGDVHAVGHNLPHGAVVKLKDVVNHLFFAFLNGSLFVARVKHHTNIFFRSGLRLLLGVDSEKAEDSVRRNAEKRHKGSENFIAERKHSAYGVGYSLRIVHSYSFWNKLAENKGYIREQQRQKHEHDCVYRLLGHRSAQSFHCEGG